MKGTVDESVHLALCQTLIFALLSEPAQQEILNAIIKGSEPAQAAHQKVIDERDEAVTKLSEYPWDLFINHRQRFAMNDGSTPYLFVAAQQHHKYNAMTIQISKVLDWAGAKFEKDNMVVPYKWVYEEINNDTDSVQYAHFVSEENVKRDYEWTKGM